LLTQNKDIPSGYLTVCHGKSPLLIGKPSIKPEGEIPKKPTGFCKSKNPTVRIAHKEH
jgi:hypothetical protein